MLCHGCGSPRSTPDATHCDSCGIRFADAPGAAPESSAAAEVPPARRSGRSSVDAVLDGTNGPVGTPLSGMGALLLVTVLGPFGGALWLTLLRRDLGAFLRRRLTFSAVLVPFVSVLTFGIVGALWRAFVLAPLVEELQIRAGLRAPTVSRAQYAIPLLHALYTQEDVAAAWLAATPS